MADRLVIDLRLPIRNFRRSVERFNKTIPEYVIDEIVNLVFDVLIFESEGHREDPDLSRMGNFYRDHLERDPVFYRAFVEYFFDIVRHICDQLRAHGLYSGDGFEFRPERNNKNRSIVVKKFDRD